MGVGLAHQPPGGLEGFGWRGLGPLPDRLGDDLGGDGGQWAVRVGGRTDAAALLGDHGGHPGGQVAQVVGQVGVVADDHALVAEVAVGPEGLSAQKLVAKAVHAKVLDQFGRGDLVERRLRHLLAADQQVAVHVELPGRCLAGGHQHGGPVHAVEPQDVLGQQMVDRRPPVLEALAIRVVADGGHVVDQRVVPDVEHVTLGPRHGDAPLNGRSADRDVLKAATDQAERLVALALGLHGVRVGLVPVEQRLGERRQAKEPVLLGQPLDRLAVDLAQRRVAARGVLDEVVVVVVGLAGHAVPALVGARVDVAVVVDPLHEGLDGVDLSGLGGADEVVEADLQQVPGLAVAVGVQLGVLGGRAASCFGRPRHLLAVLIGAGEEEHLVADQTVPTGQRIGGERGVRVADVGGVIDVIDRGRDVVAAHTPRLPTLPRRPELAWGGGSERRPGSI